MYACDDQRYLHKTSHHDDNDQRNDMDDHRGILVPVCRIRSVLGSNIGHTTTFKRSRKKLPKPADSQSPNQPTNKDIAAGPLHTVVPYNWKKKHKFDIRDTSVEWQVVVSTARISVSFSTVSPGPAPIPSSKSTSSTTNIPPVLNPPWLPLFPPLLEAPIVDFSYTNLIMPGSVATPVSRTQARKDRMAARERNKLADNNGNGKRGSSSGPPSNGTPASGEKDAKKNKPASDANDEVMVIEDGPPSPQRDVQMVAAPEMLSTKANGQFFDLTTSKDGKPLSTFLTEDMYAEAKVPFRALFGEPPSSAHDDATKMLLCIGMVSQKTRDIDINVLKRTLMDTQVALMACISIVKEEAEVLKILTEAEMRHFHLTAMRMASTKPKLICGNVKNSQTQKTNLILMWFVPINSVGSLYSASSKPRKQATLEECLPKKSTPDPKASLKRASSPDPPAGGPKKLPADSTTNSSKTSSKSDAEAATLQLGTSPNKKAAKALEECQYATRVSIKLTLGDCEGSNPAREALKQLLTYYIRLKENDRKSRLFPWNEEDMQTTPAILSADAFPTDKASSFAVYTQGAFPKKDSQVYYKLYVRHDVESVHILSGPTSDINDWFVPRQERAGYLCAVQNASLTRKAGQFLYGGRYNDVRAVQAIVLACAILCQSKMKPKNKELAMGLCIQKNKDIPSARDRADNPGNKDQLLDESQLITVECALHQTRFWNTLLKKLYNNVDALTPRPGGYRFRYLPEPDLVRAGSKGLKNRNKLLQRHKAVARSIQILRCDQVVDLDSPITQEGKKITLRSFLNEQVKIPLVAKEGVKQQPLFHSIDKASWGRDLEQGITYFAVYNDHVKEAEDLLAILIAFVAYEFDRDIALQWCNPCWADLIEGTEFDEDIDGNFLGTWTTEDEKEQEELINEQCAVALDFTNIDLQLDNEEEQGPVLMRGDDASIYSFKTAFGSPQDSSQPKGADAQAGQAAAVSGGGPG